MRHALAALPGRAFDHRADLLAAAIYGCLAFLSFNALADYANGHHLFPEPWGGYAFAVAIDGSVLYAFISFSRAQILAGMLLVSGAAATYLLQRWHAAEEAHPLIVAGVVPFFMVQVTFAWHRIHARVPAVATASAPEDAPTTDAPRKLTPADREALRRAHKRGPERVAEVIAERNLDPALATAQSTNGHKPKQEVNA